MHDTRPLLEKTDFPAIYRDDINILQVNLGYLCNLSCVHCHVNAGPTRTELMSDDNIHALIKLFDNPNIDTLDLTGGAPEMHPLFKKLVIAAKKHNINIIDRCNLVILQEPDYTDLADFLYDHDVNIVASLPCYLEDNVDKQRGKGVFQQSIAALQKLNALGYGLENNDTHQLNLVFNPQDATLPPPQHDLEIAYKKHLKAHYDIVFNQLYTVTNMPIQRFGSTLISKGTFDDYLSVLKDNFSAHNLDSLMCKNTLSIDWQGYTYDCDFNQMLDLPLGSNPKKQHFTDLNLNTLHNTPIATLQHCYGCTAGQGSSCAGSLT